jgi:ABC-type microcin C transport system permease subunit YejB
MIAQIFFGLFLVAFGIACVRWNTKIADALRDFDSLAKIGGGDVYNGTKVLGVISILLGITITLGLWQGLLSWIMGIFFGQIK